MSKKDQLTIVVGMSGGVDSSVCAALLKEQGHNVIGLFMKNWEEVDENGVCTSAKDFVDVEKVCEQIGIPYYSINFVKEYSDNVFSEFLKEYKNGHTPNPDILCNKEIKFKVFFDEAMKLGADYLATGHYCQVGQLDNKAVLKKGLDRNKDQSYFLLGINGDVLDKVMFPIGHLEKTNVRELAKKYKLTNASKKDSTGICFIGERNFKPFLENYLKPNPGEFQNLDGTVVGEHTGVAFYTIGQRKGLGLGGPGEAWFVVEKDIEKNIIFVERGENHPALYSKELWIENMNYISIRPNSFPFKCSTKIRYRQTDQTCTVYQEGELLKVVFDEPQRAITLRQYCVLYNEEICLGGGVIVKRGPRLDQL